MTASQYRLRSGAYYDSVVLMQLQRDLAALPGVIEAGVVMATPTNLALLAHNDLLPDGLTAKPDDLLVVVRAEDAAAAAAALDELDELLARRRSPVGGAYRPRSLGAALRGLPEANWALISVPGRYATAVAREALTLGLHVFLYSDNVSVEDELALKAQACAHGKLLMGPDCGTAIVNGVGLGFANRVRRGGVGLVGASGTGLQAVSVRLHRLGAGVSHALGTGGRDLSAAIGGTTTTQSLDLLARDPNTKVICLVSKPPDADTAARLFAAARRIAKPVVVNLLGYVPPAKSLGNLHFAAGLSETARLAVDLLSESPEGEAGPDPKPLRGYLRGLFSGGTLATEALFGLRGALAPLYTNLSIPGTKPLPDPAHSQAHTILDLGADEFTVGRLHPMIDQTMRIERLRREAADPAVGAILLDVVLGEGAHPDPAAELAPAIAAARRERDLPILVVLIGTDEDPQDAPGTAQRLLDSGAILFEDSADAVAYLSARLDSAPEKPLPPVPLEALDAPLAAVNLGLESFNHSLIGQGARSVHVDWRPPAGGDERMQAILEKLKA